ncbi:MAG TPA: class I SAM-dependent methyltransferase [Sideroxyarcus sp.]|nr:class I SAM-dependent methyltransferase [Sideroxyarcus sp.]
MTSLENNEANMQEMKQVTPEILDRFATDYYDNADIKDRHLENLVQIQAVPKIMQYINLGDRVIEMGFGDGVMTPEFIKNSITQDIIEGSAILAKRARERFPSLKIIHSMFEDFVPEQRYDVVLSFHVLEHVEDVPCLLRHVRKWLKKDGKIIAIVPNAESIHRQLAVAMGMQGKVEDLSPRDGLVGHLRVYTLDAFKKDFEDAGFKVESEFGNFIKTVPNSMMLDYPDDLLQALCGLDVLPPHLLANIGVCARKVGE